MLATIIKIVITAVLVVAISEVAKRSSLFGAVLASIPLTSVLAMVGRSCRASLRQAD